MGKRVGTIGIPNDLENSNGFRGCKMELVNDGDMNTAILDVVHRDSIDHIHATVPNVKSTLIISVYTDESGEARTSAELKGSIFELVGALQFWLAYQLSNSKDEND